MPLSPFGSHVYVGYGREKESKESGMAHKLCHFQNEAKLFMWFFWPLLA